MSGERLLDPEQAREAAGSLGQNLLMLRTGEIEEAVQRISVVREAHASLVLSGHLEVEVEERSPAVRWQCRDGSFLVDREGIVFSREAPPDPVPLIREVNGPALEMGGRIDPAILNTVVTLETTLPRQVGIRAPWYDYVRGSGVAVPIEGGPRVIFGDAEDLDSKLAALVAVRQHLETNKANAEVIDLRFKGRPTYVLPPPPAPAKSSQQVRR